MKTCLGALPALLTRIMLALFIALMACTLYLGAFQNGETQKAFGLGLLALAAMVLVLPLLSRLLARLGPLWAWVILTLLCLAVKGAWILLVRVPQAYDYATFWSYAQQLAQQDTLAYGRYMALFPHVFGYSSFLSWFIRLFGEGELVAQWVNVVLTAISGSFLFLIGKRWWGLAGGISVYLLWIACPSQTMYNVFALSEPLYTTLLLAVLTLIAWAEEGKKLPVVVGLAAGVLLRLFQGVRPIAAVVLIALVIWRFCLKPEELGRREGRRYWLPLVGLTLAAYLVTGPLWNAHLAARIGEEPATSSGYSFLVGFNYNYSGQWNQGDSDLLFSFSNEPGATAQQAQEKAMEAAKERITSGQINFPALMKEKMKNLMGTDDACVNYSRAVLRHHEAFSLLCNTFYYAVLLLGAAGAVVLWRRNDRSAMLLLPLYILGLTCAQMLVEVAGRYHYSILPALLLLAQPVLMSPALDWRKILRKKRESP
ncbi:glycosyltransferase family 39 protein [Pseudoflavonifractor phocaeensis]|uniref:glycosyltransferase family 39 protein n=1 Tax=Pseudoflavonifractor phocaeensis TaxID=1870988 RepID=UPI00195F0B9D|nr:glycosyltransferase family 39 protein [Pseudoflavonifractor phocaeensis]MBM6924975.1 glycosyltransferase family 39 protein [Pseudoflavonifractor phocaeensis]